MQALCCCVGGIGGSVEIFLEHDRSEATPGLVPYLTNSTHEDQDHGDEETVGGYDDEADDEADDDEADGEPHYKGGDEADEADEDDDDNDAERPREDHEADQSEDENPAEEQDIPIDDDDGDDVVINEGDGATDERFSSLFKEELPL
ncbi:hypothetical protein AALP_AA8G250000 [Arabis alpina]|uniref:Uncharacterized protein n=1 Tax=Arabis alpina TaxID=50452 RepID=A0A087G997_ARAAL|nr:hypothetical protein AALP_AA8G250000 [Arabis alpina]